MMPGLTVRVHDAYITGEGILHAAVLGRVTMVNLHGTGDVARGELMRFLAEAAWRPTSLLPSQGVLWAAADDHAARATLKDGDTTPTLLFRFTSVGLIDTVRTEVRGRTAAGTVPPLGGVGSGTMRYKTACACPWAAKRPGCCPGWRHPTGARAWPNSATSSPGGRSQSIGRRPTTACRGQTLGVRRQAPAEFTCPPWHDGGSRREGERLAPGSERRFSGDRRTAFGPCSVRSAFSGRYTRTSPQREAHGQASITQRRRSAGASSLLRRRSPRRRELRLFCRRRRGI